MLVQCALVSIGVILSFLLIGTTNSENIENVTVTIAQGQLCGLVSQSSSGRDFYSFLGVPFGESKERFKPPKPAKPWTGILNATEEGPDCMQTDNWMGKGFYGEEDCLTLNIYTPKLPEPDQPFQPLPVMVFFFGGGFLFGSASADWYGPENYMNNDIILVLMQYRVGPFGFLSTGDEESPGNYGLLDQNLALKWVNKNIEAFGGDVNKVSISGVSAGGGSVIFHLLSPLSKGLFHSAIAHSGTALGPWAIQRSPLSVAQRIAKELDCPLNNTKDMMSCLKEVDGLELMRATNASNMYSSLIDATVPVVENSVNGRFLTESPWKLLREGRFNKVPLISGTTRDEGSYVPTFKIPGIDSFYNESKDVFFGEIIPKLYTYMTGLETNSSIIDTISEYYFSDVDFDIEGDVIKGLIEFGTDVWFRSGSDAVVKLAVGHGVPVRSYLFDYATAEHQLSNATGRPDVSHGMDFRYSFKVRNKFLKFKSNLTNEEERLVANLINMWGNFTDSGNPTQDDVIQWTPTTSEEITFLHIDASPTMQTISPEQARRSAFWMKVFEDADAMSN